jgi:two-component system sensor histidine kinase FlrB
VVVLDGDDRIIQSNPAAHELFGSLNHGELWDEVYRQHFIPGQSGEEQQLYSGIRVTLTERWLHPEPGRILLLLDVTETRELQERLDRRQRLSAMGEMAAQLAHQIRTPLSSALLYTSHLTTDDLSVSKRHNLAQRIRARLLLMERQINDMLAFARGGQYSPEAVAISALLQELSQILEPILQHGSAHYKFNDCTAGECQISGNYDALLGAIMNLANNALQHGGDGITLKITLEQISDEWLQLQISDNGSGISQDIREHIFDPFFTTSSEGTGLGLAVVQSVILGHNGCIRLLPEPEGGTCFQIELPLASVQDEGQPAEQDLTIDSSRRRSA